MRWIHLILLAALPACRTAQALESAEAPPEPVIGFLSLRIHQQQPDLKLLAYERAQGAFKRTTGYDNAPNRLTVLMFRQNRFLDSIQIPHPLIRQAEFPDEHGHYTSRTAVLDSADFFIRIQVETRPDELRFLDYRYDNPVRRLNSLSLPTS